MHTHIVVGLAYGDEGKGSWVDHLVRTHGIRTVVRHNGGAQALHHVHTPSGVVHGFSQFGSGTFVAGVETVLSRFMLLEPLAALAEAQRLAEVGVPAPLTRLCVSARAPIIPYANVLLNRIMETARGNARHGSCGLGIGLTQGDVEQLGGDALYAGDMQGRQLEEKVTTAFARARLRAQEWVSPETEALIEELGTFDINQYVALLRSFASLVRVLPDEAVLETLADTPVVFEGAQGVLLDQYQGFFPHVTRSTTTDANARTLLAEAGYQGQVVTHGLLRAYGTRHGAGPFVTEDSSLAVPACDNAEGEWQGVFRVGWFDAVAARYALSLMRGVDSLVVTNLDRLDGVPVVRIATEYDSMDDRWYDTRTHTLRQVSTYDESVLRTKALEYVHPVYQAIKGWRHEGDGAMEQYLDALGEAIGQNVTAVSRGPGATKLYRPRQRHAIAA